MTMKTAEETRGENRERLATLLAGTAHAVIGGTALGSHVQVAGTGDFEVLVTRPLWLKILPHLKEWGAQPVARSKHEVAVKFPECDEVLRFREATTPLELDVISQRKQTETEKLAYADADHLAALRVKAHVEAMVEANRAKTDVQWLLLTGGANKEGVRRILKKYERSLLKEFTKLIKGAQK